MDSVINPDAGIRDNAGGTVNINVIQGDAVRRNVGGAIPMPGKQAAAPWNPQVAETAQPKAKSAWPVDNLKNAVATAQTAVAANGLVQEAKNVATGKSKFSMDNVMRRAKNLSKKAGKMIDGGAGSLLEKIPVLGPLAKVGKILIILTVILLIMVIISFFRGNWLWGFLGLLVDVGVAVGIYFGVQAMPMKAKLLGMAAIGLDGFMIIFLLIRAFMGS
jgi:hypothetical protein